MTAEVLDFAAYRRLGEPQPGVPELDREPLLFIDWLTIRQVHPGGGLPLVSDGCVVVCDRDGVMERQTIRRDQIEGSYDSRMWLRCDGNAIEFHGNIARYNRPDNVFGYDWFETIRRVNTLLNLHNLPPFTPGQMQRYADTGVYWDGARVSRIDLTMNYACFSEANAQRVILALGQHKIGRQQGTVAPDSATVMYGYGSTYVSQKVYIKAQQMKRHLTTKHGEHVDLDVLEWCRDLGVIREEMTLKSRLLTQSGLCWLGEITGAHLQQVYAKRSQFRRFRQMDIKDTSALSAAARGVLARYEQGEPHGLKKSRYYEVRNEILLHIGVDIAVPRNVERIALPVKVIEIQPLVAPEWYRRKSG